MRRNLGVVAFLAVMTSLGGFAGWLWGDYQKAVRTAVVPEEVIYIDIVKGDSLQRIAEKLSERHVLVRPLWFKVCAWRHNVANKLKTGEYELTPGATLPEVLSLFAEGKTKQYSITFPEGWTFRQSLQALQNREKLIHSLEHLSTQDIAVKLQIGAQLPEGWFFPDTYNFEKNMTDISILQRAYRRMQEVLQQEWEQREPGLPLRNAYEALILASIVEKETAVAAERPLIAGVFIRRLQKGMLLQTDPTVIYGMGEYFNGNLTSRDLRTETPYNTYVVAGLPPTPIAQPGRGAIHAALHPAKDESLYFVARGDGTHVFSETLDQHQLAVDVFQKNDDKRKIHHSRRRGRRR
jgi:UPF0755 protein